MKQLYWLTCCLACCLRTYSQTPLIIPYNQLDKRIDGYSDDWSEGHEFRFVLENKSLADTAFDNRVRARFEWDEFYLYGLVEVADRHLIKLRYGNDNPTLNLGDAIEVYIDPLNDSRDRMDVNDYQFIMDAGNERAILKGDRRLADSLWQAPKEVGTATVAFQFKSVLKGTLNRESDRDTMWQVEFALPWAALGKIAGKDSLFRLDLCLNDMDSLIDLRPIPEGAVIPCFSYGTWDGYDDFGFPQHWRVYRLSGGPDWWLLLERKYLRWWLPLLLATALVFASVVWFLLRKIRLLRQVPVRAEMEVSAFTQLIQNQSNTQSPASPNAEIYDRLRDFILDNLHRDLSPADLARHAHLSLRQLQRIFKEEMDSSPSTFILLIKMEKAAEMLRAGKSNVSEIAYDLGFSDPGYFSKVFRKYFGTAPSSFL